MLVDLYITCNYLCWGKEEKKIFFFTNNIYFIENSRELLEEGTEILADKTYKSVAGKLININYFY